MYLFTRNEHANQFWFKFNNSISLLPPLILLFIFSYWTVQYFYSNIVPHKNASLEYLCTQWSNFYFTNPYFFMNNCL